MVQQQATLTVTYAVCNTGPLISAFQSGSFSLLAQIFAEIHISTVCVGELIRHGWEAEIKAATPPLVIVALSATEEQQALTIAEEISRQPNTNDPVVVNHLEKRKQFDWYCVPNIKMTFSYWMNWQHGRLPNKAGSNYLAFQGHCSWLSRLDYFRLRSCASD